MENKRFQLWPARGSMCTGREQANMFVQSYWQKLQVENSLFFFSVEDWDRRAEDVNSVMAVMRFVIDSCQSFRSIGLFRR